MRARIGLVLVVLAALFAAVVATRPAEFTVTRSRVMAAPPALVFAQLDDFQRWMAWSPWERKDPGMRREFSGAPSGAGAVYAWFGNREVGEGRMTITESRPDERLALRLEFTKPMQATNEVEFALSPSGSGTELRWSMRGRNGFLGKALSLFLDMDQMVGRDFETGLAQLDAVTAAQAQPGR